jgi:uncharacterized protein YeaO (DUF488 family)
MFTLKRAYEKPSKSDGTRVLVERLWPRGLRKDEAQIDLWLKEVAPSTELRQWFGHDPQRWEEFRKRYRDELKRQQEPVERLIELGLNQKVTLIYAARDEQHNSALLLKDWLDRLATRKPAHAGA